MLWVKCTKANGKTVKPKESECTSTLTDLNTRDNGLMTNKKERGSKLGKTALNTTGITPTEKNRVRVYLCGQTETNMTENFMIVILKEPAFTHLRMEDDTKDSGRTIKCMAKDYIPGQTVRCIMDSLLKTLNMDMVNSSGQMEKYIRGLGKMGNNMDREV